MTLTMEEVLRFLEETVHIPRSDICVLSDKAILYMSREKTVEIVELGISEPDHISLNPGEVRRLLEFLTDLKNKEEI